jgi:hypothetical protein
MSGFTVRTVPDPSPVDAVVADAPGCVLCTWVLRGPLWHLKYVNRQCSAHGHMPLAGDAADPRGPSRWPPLWHTGSALPRASRAPGGHEQEEDT